MSNILLSPNYAAAMVAMALDDPALSKELLVKRFDDEAYDRLTELMQSGLLKTYADEVKNMLLSYDEVGAIMPDYRESGLTYATYSGAGHLQDLGVLNGELIAGGAIPAIAQHYKKDPGELAFFEIMRKFYEFGVTHSDMFSTNFYNTFFNKQLSMSPDYEIFDRQYGITIIEPLPKNVDYATLFSFLCLYSIATMNAQLTNSPRDPRVSEFDAFFVFLQTDYGPSLQHQTGWTHKFYEQTLGVSDCIKYILSHLSVDLLKKLKEISFHKYFWAEIASQISVYFGENEARLRVVAGEARSSDIKGEYRTYQLTDSLASRRSDASIAIRMIIGPDASLKPIKAPLTKILEYKAVPAYQEYRAAVDTILKQVSGEDAHFDRVLVASAAKTMASVSSSRTVPRFAALGRIVTYLSVPIGIAETLTYGGPWIGLATGLLGVGAQVKLDTQREPRWITQLRDL